MARARAGAAAVRMDAGEEGQPKLAKLEALKVSIGRKEGQVDATKGALQVALHVDWPTNVLFPECRAPLDWKHERKERDRHAILVQSMSGT